MMQHAGRAVRLRGHIDAFELTFLAQDIEQHRRGWQRFPIPEQVHEIVEVAATCAFGECAPLFSEQLLMSVGKHVDPFFGCVCVRMKSTHALWRKDNAFVRCEVELDS